jgi:undecaprenyl-diphosphatase
MRVLSVMDALRSVDDLLMRALTSWHTGWLDVVMIWMSRIGGGGRLWIALAVLALTMPRHRAAAWRVLLTLFVAAVLADAVMKPLIGRTRPQPDATVVMRALPHAPASFSFPSGHAATAIGGVIAVCRMFPQGRVVWWLAALLIAWSRVYLWHHFPLDVLSGALVGIAAAFWVLGGHPRSTDTRTLPDPLPSGVIVRP